MKKLIILIVSSILSLTVFSQNRYIQKQDGEIVKEKTFYQEKDELVQKFKKKMRPGVYFDIFYEFDKPIKKNDSIIVKVLKVTFSTFPPEINRKNVFNEKAIKGRPLPETSFQTIEGKVLTMKDLIGKPLIINFWHTGCRPCIKEIPVLNEIKKKYGNKVNFISVTFETKEKVEQFIGRYEFNFTHIINAADFMNSIQFKEFPKTFYLDKEGIVQKIEGAITIDLKKDMVEYIDSMLKH